MKKLHSTLDIKMNSILRIYKKGFGYARLIVTDVTEHFFSVSGDDDFVAHVGQGDVVEAYYWVEHSASYEFTLEVLGKFEKELKLVFFKHTDALTWSEERKCLTAEVSIPFKFFTFSVDESAKVFSSKNVDPHEGAIVSLSDREALVRYDGVIEKNTFMRGHILVRGDDLAITGKPVPVPEAGQGVYRIEFSGMSEKERNRILDYIFTIYRE